ncbi:hypothetical protein METBIDRAFT_43044 [Metschnikowia bicuspidata var. bicuspidata NRRL YB-4993]|uniref:Signal recognition particle subunit SRP68 n=1 Tax=Metschnikowia bicuspidata var. bicuspidata NRRL YB-4993 TaxID=869754 RepID=A0A1A0H940_9ASCO|nr:hypothetical protein METBIDRAFT_43044 [Metschnikowia bicuspidata var. bicuspidata NRRL YB-4993]OBA20397.1 hypothetical protein METBIDRAFT_43044 [Metschnikowia bicuspidata var. bicuspidata NRRL YB-4993]
MSSSGPLADTFGRRLQAYLTSPQDFRKYRQKLSRELVRLRHDLNIVTRDTRNYRDKERTSAIGAEQYQQNGKYGQVLLLLAERSLVHSLEIKSMLEIKGLQIPGYKKLMVGKLKLAAKSARRLVGAVACEPDATRKLEYYVFAALLQGQYSVNKKLWADARYALSLARIGLEYLAVCAGQNGASSADDALWGKAFLDETLDTVVDPALSLAHLQDASSHKTAADLRTVARKHCRGGNVPYLAPLVDLVAAFDPAFVEELAEETVPKSVAWRAHSAAIYNDEVAVKLSKVAGEDWRLYRDANDYDSLFSRWADLVDIHQGDVEKSSDDDDMDRTQHNAVLLTYLKYHMLFVKVKRDLLLIEQLHAQPSPSTTRVLSTNKDVVRLYASLVRTTEELKDLPGVYNDDDLYESLEGLSRLFTVTRSAVVADSYAAARKLAEALAIYLHIQRTFSGAPLYYKVDAFPYDVSSNEQVAHFRAHVATRTAQYHTLAQLQREVEGVVPPAVAEDVYKFPASVESLNHVTHITEKGFIAPVLSKPVLFDVAFNYIGYSAEGEKTASKSSSGLADTAGDVGDKKKGGFFGIFGRG